MKYRKLKILFRTSGGKAPKKQLGFGHVYRCINLADFLKGNQLFFLIEDYGGVENVLREKGFHRISKIENGVKALQDVRRTINEINKKKIDVLIVDKFDINPRFLNAVRKHAKVIVISDLWKYDFPADLVVNGFIGFNNKVTRNKFGTRCLLGPRFQILNRRFADKPKSQNKKYELLATFGGFDENNIVELLLEQLLKIKQKIKVKIILGPATKETQRIRQLAKEYGKNLEIIRQTTNMYKEITNAKFGLCSGGITTYEFATMHKHFGIISQVKHQLITSKEWQRRGIAINLGMRNRNINKKIQAFLKNIIEEKIRYQNSKMSIGDGLGTQRVAKEILRLF